MTDEKRKFTRVPFRIYAEMQYEESTICGKVTDLSLKGLFVQTSVRVDIGADLDVMLRLPSTIPPLEFRFRAVVVRLAEDGIGLEIVESELQSFTHLRNIVALHVADPDRVIDELFIER